MKKSMRLLSIAVLITVIGITMLACGGNPTNEKPEIEGMVWIEGGSFRMGSPENEPGRWDGWSENENPRTANGGVVTISGFYMGKFPVTQAQYEEVMGSNPSHFQSAENSGSLPVETVRWFEAIVFCNKLSMLEDLTPAYVIDGKTDPSQWGAVPTSTSHENYELWNTVQVVSGSTGYRLPTEAQWEYAARAGTTTAFNWGTNTINETQANYRASHVDANNLTAGTNRNTTTVQGTFTPNAWWLYDMHGNVFEWCWDWYTGSYDNAGGSNDPMGPDSSEHYRVIRAGSWLSQSGPLRSAFRGSARPTRQFDYLGFRVVRP